MTRGVVHYRDMDQLMSMCTLIAMLLWLPLIVESRSAHRVGFSPPAWLWTFNMPARSVTVSFVVECDAQEQNEIKCLSAPYTYAELALRLFGGRGDAGIGICLWDSTPIVRIRGTTSGFKVRRATRSSTWWLPWPPTWSEAKVQNIWHTLSFVLCEIQFPTLRSDGRLIIFDII